FAFVVALTVAGFIAAGVWDSTGEVALPGLSAFWSLPRAARILVEIVVGVPLAFGAALYFITQALEFLWQVSWPSGSSPKRSEVRPSRHLGGAPRMRMGLFPSCW